MLLFPVVFASAAGPMAVLLLPVVLLNSALSPMAVLLPPVVLSVSAPNPTAVLLLPLVLAESATSPTAVLLLPSMLAESARSPTAVFWAPVVLFPSARLPMAVLLAPVVLAVSAPSPMAVLLLPVVLESSALIPMAVLKLPILWRKSAPPALIAIFPVGGREDAGAGVRREIDRRRAGAAVRHRIAAGIALGGELLPVGRGEPRRHIEVGAQGPPGRAQMQHQIVAMIGLRAHHAPSGLKPAAKCSQSCAVDGASIPAPC